jgi:hypothetical protein
MTMEAIGKCMGGKGNVAILMRFRSGCERQRPQCLILQPTGANLAFNESPLRETSRIFYRYRQ